MGTFLPQQINKVLPTFIFDHFIQTDHQNIEFLIMTKESIMPAEVSNQIIKFKEQIKKITNIFQPKMKHLTIIYYPTDFKIHPIMQMKLLK